jgi:flagellar protein FliO/FliZ
MDVASYLRFIIVLVLVLGLILAFAWLMKRLGFGDAMRGPLGRRRRIGTVEAAAIDGRHRVVLVRRDDVEHLLLIGPNTSQVIERGIPVASMPPAGDGTGEAPANPTFFSAFQQLLSKEKQP